MKIISTNEKWNQINNNWPRLTDEEKYAECEKIKNEYPIDHPQYDAITFQQSRYNCPQNKKDNSQLNRPILEKKGGIIKSPLFII